jgi:hypothetical protein
LRYQHYLHLCQFSGACLLTLRYAAHSSCFCSHCAAAPGAERMLTPSESRIGLPTDCRCRWRCCHCCLGL